MGRYGTMLVGPIVFAVTVSGCYTQFGATREETYAEEPEYELYEDAAAYAEEYTEEGYEEARERFYFDYYYPTFSGGFSIGGPWYGGRHYTYYDPYWWGPGWFYSAFWSPWCWYPAYYYYPVSYGYYGYPYAWHYSSYPVHSPGAADVHTRTRGFGNTRTAGGNRDVGGTSRDGRRDPNIVLAGGAYRSPKANPGAVDRPSRQSTGRTGQNRQPVAGDRNAGLDREVTAPGRLRSASLKKFGSVEPVRVKIRKSRTPSGSSRVKSKSENSGSRRTYKPSSPQSSKPGVSYGGSRGSVRSSPSGASRSGSAPRSAPRSSGGSRGRSRR
jgi:hypothetical protein